MHNVDTNIASKFDIICKTQRSAVDTRVCMCVRAYVFPKFVCVWVCVYVCVCMYVCACVRACARVRVAVYAMAFGTPLINVLLTE